MISFTEAVRRCLAGWITFSGRGPRSEFWWFVLFQALLYVAMVVALLVLGSGFVLSDPSPGIFGGIGVIFLALLPLYLFLFISNMSAVVRRLHDRNLSGWWYGGFLATYFLQGFAALADPTNNGLFGIALSILWLIGLITLIMLLCLPGTSGANRFGPNPLMPAAPEVFE